MEPPWCPHCKRVKKFLAAHRVRYAFVDIDTDPQAITRLKELQDGGQIIPTVVYPDGTHEVNPSNEALARRIGLTLKAERSAYDLVIVGGGPAGLAAAIYAAREGIDAVVVDASALGAGVHFCATCDAPFYKGAEEVVVIGGGNSALEEGLHLSEFAKRVRVLSRSGLSASPILQERVRSDPQFAIRTGVDIVELEDDRGRFAAVLARDRDSGEILRFPAAAAFVFIGLKPNDGFLGDTVKRDKGEFIVTSATMETSLPGVFAAGDVRSGSTKQLGSAVGDGIAALLMTRRYLEVHHHKSMPLVDA